MSQGAGRLLSLIRGLKPDAVLWAVLGEPRDTQEVSEPEVPVPVDTDWRSLVPGLGGVIHEG